MSVLYVLMSVCNSAHILPLQNLLWMKLPSDWVYFASFSLQDPRLKRKHCRRRKKSKLNRTTSGKDNGDSDKLWPPFLQPAPQHRVRPAAAASSGEQLRAQTNTKRPKVLQQQKASMMRKVEVLLPSLNLSPILCSFALRNFESFELFSLTWPNSVNGPNPNNDIKLNFFNCPKGLRLQTENKLYMYSPKLRFTYYRAGLWHTTDVTPSALRPSNQERKTLEKKPTLNRENKKAQRRDHSSQGGQTWNGLEWTVN